MTGEVTDRFNEITLFGMALFLQKAIALTYRVERLFNSEFYGCLHFTDPQSNFPLHHTSHSFEEDMRGGGGGGLLIKVGMDVWARALGISEVNFCPGIRFWEVNFPEH